MGVLYPLLQKGVFKNQKVLPPLKEQYLLSSDMLPNLFPALDIAP